MTDHAEAAPLTAADALLLYTTFAAAGIHCWVMGGWGVDALLGRHTRPHHDLDLLVSVADLGDFLDLLAENGFSQKLVWHDENRWVDVRGVKRPTAFVEVDGRGRELDIHVIELVPHGPPRALCDVPWTFDDGSLRGVGVIAGVAVRCVSAETQLQMHTGYDLPPQHQRDAEHLARHLSERDDPTVSE